MNLRDRIVELRRIKASELKANALNWREHPDEQKGALTAMLEKLGFAGAILARETDEGKIQIIDGHMRADLVGEFKVPVLMTDLSEEEALELLTTYDAIGAMAEADPNKLTELIGTVDLPDHADLRKLVADMDFNKPKRKEKPEEHEVEGMALRPHEHYDYIVVLASTTHDWNKLCDRLGISPKKRKRKRSMGVCRAIKAEQLLSILPEQKPNAGGSRTTEKGA